MVWCYANRRDSIEGSFKGETRENLTATCGERRHGKNIPCIWGSSSKKDDFLKPSFLVEPELSNMKSVYSNDSV